MSTGDQDVELQLDALRESGCPSNLVFVDKVSSARSSRPDLDACLNALESTARVNLVKYIVKLINSQT